MKVATVLVTVRTVPALITAKVATVLQRPSYNREGGDRPYRPRFNNGEGGGYRSNNGGGYETAELALMDTDLKRTFATGIAGFSHVIDSLSAIKYAKVKVVRDESGLAKDFEIEGEFPKYGNDDDRADEIGVWLLKTFMDKLKKHHTYRDSEPTTSILTITSNVVYGKATGAMPDGRKAGEPLSPGANPSYGAEQNGLLASLNSLTKLPYEWALDGISNTQTINPGALGNNEGERIDNLVNVMDGYFDQGSTSPQCKCIR